MDGGLKISMVSARECGKEEDNDTSKVVIVTHPMQALKHYAVHSPFQRLSLR